MSIPTNIVLAAIDADVATLTRIVDAPDSTTLGYGTDLSCVSDLTDDFAEVDPFSPIGIAQAAIRRLTCPRGANPDDANYGLYLPGYCNSGVTADDLRDLNGLITNELLKDDRIDDLVATTTYAAPTKSLKVSIQITPADPVTGVFAFTFSVTDSSVLLETIN